MLEFGYHPVGVQTVEPDLERPGHVPAAGRSRAALVEVNAEEEAGRMHTFDRLAHRRRERVAGAIAKHARAERRRGRDVERRARIAYQEVGVPMLGVLTADVDLHLVLEATESLVQVELPKSTS